MLGNTFAGTLGNGLSTNHGLGGFCENNIIVANKVDGPYGMNIRYARNTFAFNNNIQTGQFGVYSTVVDNYTSQNHAASGDMLFWQVDVNPYFVAPYFIATCSMDP